MDYWSEQQNHSVLLLEKNHLSKFLTIKCYNLLFSESYIIIFPFVKIILISVR